MIWDPPSTLFTIPFLNHPIKIYGFLFALGFFIGYLLLSRSLGKAINDPPKGRLLTDRLVWFTIIGCIVGARLGHVLFYDQAFYFTYPHKILYVWEGGLASHGGTVGVFIALLILWFRGKNDFKPLSFLQFFDLFIVPVALVGMLIRLGNFFNQEVLGTPTNLPWGITFLHPADGLSTVPRHPVQLYEALLYFFIFASLSYLSTKKLRTGVISGLFFISIFSGRFILEFWKSSQGGVFDDNIIQTGQLLSLPFILIGIFLVFKKPKTLQQS
ncbi:prolipoprotein diacylglyceryl transferase [Chlamydiales bacterium]|nr:prolipoprotein diacylglyceryl transferase [Chlamydiales bacterium]